ncbi:hypothetical protein C9J03_13690 [Photobacterium gaetbulicola]|uniref:DoxX family protein n=1 Tax=Photobacterium gaetbulicola Gung47 TaxID=658445 RepID=A0A0C5WTF9_9GAMM|nr:hypothetical protein [Photobacterium gaetbulicola]AJR06290.1 hypothetical protein H744_1c1267 [Photobacterium gaetbulicola Gung47]PSU08767.1 hypothetical protein C9J03_13690 [Photobacterium gaetbulicola]
MKYISLLFISLFSLPSWAHVRWFVNSTQYTDVSLPVDALFYSILVAVLGFCLFAYVVTRQGLIGSVTSNPVMTDTFFFWRLLTVVMALFFILNVVLGEFIAPNLQLDTGREMIGVCLQVAVATVMVFSVTISGFMILLIAIASSILLPFSAVIDYLPELIGIGGALVLIGPYITPFDKKMFSYLAQQIGGREAAVILLRFMLGLQLLILGLHNKLMLPGLSLTFLEMYPYYNFFQLLGWEAFSHLHFVWFVGLSESLLGLMLMLGFANRLVMGLLATIFLITTYVAGPADVLGHLPIFAIAFILLCESVNKVPSAIAVKTIDLGDT